MNKKIIWAVVITFIVTAFLTSYALYLFQAKNIAFNLNLSKAREAGPDEGGGGAGDGGFTRSQGSSVGASISYFQWIIWSVTTSWCINCN